VGGWEEVTLRESMTPRERWLAVLSHHKPDRIPTDFRATPEAVDRLLAHCRCGELSDFLERYHVDPIVEVAPRYRGPELRPNTDVFGIEYTDYSYGTGAYREPIYLRGEVPFPLAHYTSVEEIERNYRWPDPDWWDYSGIADQVEGKEHLVIRGGGSEPFATYKDLRGVEQAYLDLVLNPEIVHYCLDKLFALRYEDTRRIYEQIPGKVIWTWVAEDFGSQEGLLISLETIRRFFLPRMKRMVDLVHEAGAYAFFHSDGAVRAAVPDFAAIGMDVLDPIQWRARGMDRAALKRDFGSVLAFHGGMDNQYTLAFGTEAEIRQEVLDNLSTLGKDGGYILGPSHNIQVVSPPENIITMYQTAYESGWQ
jgi:uroporphyrinogen decarboxylase